MTQGHGRATLLLIAFVGAVMGCFHPNIVDGGFFCSDAGSCPEGFRCSDVDRRCWRGGGPDVRMCSDAGPAATSFCDDPASPGQACNPVCQNGCGCGQRCVVNGFPRQVACLPIGPSPKAAGEACSITADDCGARLVCVNECDSAATMGRCLQFCKGDNDCGNGRHCLVPIEGTSLLACEAAPRSCNPVAGTGCPAPGLACFLDEVPNTKCECEGAKAAGQNCVLDTECVAGFQCVNFASQILCRKICAVPSDCLPPTVCTRTVAGAPFGFCL